MDMQFAEFLRLWRTRRNPGQLRLGLEANVSARHIGFLETGRARPGKGMVATLARALNMPRTETNRAYLAAGFAPVFKQHPETHADIARISGAIETVLQNHSPQAIWKFRRNRHLCHLAPGNQFCRRPLAHG
jgi:transcriptional regulator with XRE-family HTH domain